MLDEDEWRQVELLWSDAFSSDKTGSIDERYRPMLDLYRKLTGMIETVPASIMHHRISQYGPPCSNCSKPLRTPEAAFCVACGHQRG